MNIGSDAMEEYIYRFLFGVGVMVVVFGTIAVLYMRLEG